MASIQIRHPHSLGIPGAMAAAKQVEEMLGKYGVKIVWEGPRANVKGTGLSGFMVVNDQDIQIELELGMLLRAMTGKIEGSIKDYLAQVTGTPSP